MVIVHYLKKVFTQLSCSDNVQINLKIAQNNPGHKPHKLYSQCINGIKFHTNLALLESMFCETSLHQGHIHKHRPYSLLDLYEQMTTSGYALTSPWDCQAVRSMIIGLLKCSIHVCSSSYHEHGDNFGY